MLSELDVFFFFQISPIIIDSLEYDNKELLVVMLDVLCHLIETKQSNVVDSLQTILPRLVNLSKYVKSMVSEKESSAWPFSAP